MLVRPIQLISHAQSIDLRKWPSSSIPSVGRERFRSALEDTKCATFVISTSYLAECDKQTESQDNLNLRKPAARTTSAALMQTNIEFPLIGAHLFRIDQSESVVLKIYSIQATVPNSNLHFQCTCSLFRLWKNIKHSPLKNVKECGTIVQLATVSNQPGDTLRIGHGLPNLISYDPAINHGKFPLKTS